MGTSHKQRFQFRKRFNREFRTTIVMSIVSVADLFLVALPNLIIIYQIFSQSLWANSAVGFMFILISVRSGMNFFVLVTLNKDFKRAFVMLLLGASYNSVTAIQVVPTPMIRAAQHQPK